MIHTKIQVTEFKEVTPHAFTSYPKTRGGKNEDKLGDVVENT